MSTSVLVVVVRVTALGELSFRWAGFAGLSSLVAAAAALGATVAAALAVRTPRSTGSAVLAPLGAGDPAGLGGCRLDGRSGARRRRGTRAALRRGGVHGRDPEPLVSPPGPRPGGERRPGGRRRCAGARRVHTRPRGCARARGCRPVPVPLDRRGRRGERPRGVQQDPARGCPAPRHERPCRRGRAGAARRPGPAGGVASASPTGALGPARVAGRLLAPHRSPRRGDAGSGGASGTSTPPMHTGRCVASPEPPGCATQRPCRVAACRQRGRPWVHSRR